MGHIHTATGNHDFTVGAYIVRYEGAEAKALLHLHKSSNMLFPIGGHIELNETPWQALIREVFEESGYSFSELKVLQQTGSLRHLSDVTAHPLPVIISDHNVSESHFHTDLAYALVTGSLPLGQEAKDESHDFRWYGLNELNKLDDSIIYPNTREIYTYIINICLAKWEQLNLSAFQF